MSITDLPYDIDFDSFEKMLNKYVESGYIKDWKNFSQGTSIHYDIHFPKGALAKEIGRASVDTKLPNKFKLIKKMPEDLLWVLDENGKVKHFDTVNDLIIYFVDYRLKRYDNRKDRLVKVLNERLKQNSDMCKFIELVITGKVAATNNNLHIFLRLHLSHTICQTLYLVLRCQSLQRKSMMNSLNKMRRLRKNCNTL